MTELQVLVAKITQDEAEKMQKIVSVNVCQDDKEKKS